ncbi:MAG: VWA domain-containing protein, partial [Planctomycetota bacterium]
GQEDLTGIGTAVARAAQVLRGSVARSKVVILLTDGEETVATADTPEEIGPLRAALLSRKLGVRVYSIAAGIGKQSRSGGFVPLDKRPMQELAARTGGEFFEARDAGAVAGVYARIGELEKVEFEEPRFEVEERFLPFLIAGILLMLCRLLLQQRLLEALP